MINGKTLYAYNKDTGQREEFKVEAFSVTFANSLEYEKYKGSTSTEDGFGGGFFPAPKRTDWGTYVDGDRNTKKIPYFLSSDGKWSYAVTDISMLLRKDDAEEQYLGIHAKADDALHADEATNALACSGNSNTASFLKTARTLKTKLDSQDYPAFNGGEDAVIGVTGVLTAANGGTGKTSLADVEVGLATRATNDINGSPIATTYLEKPVISNFSVVATAWTELSTPIEEYAFQYDIDVPGITADYIPVVMIDIASQEGAQEAEMCPVAETFANCIRLRTKSRPLVTITGNYFLFLSTK